MPRGRAGSHARGDGPLPGYHVTRPARDPVAEEIQAERDGIHQKRHRGLGQRVLGMRLYSAIMHRHGRAKAMHGAEAPLPPLPMRRFCRAFPWTGR